MWIKVSLNKYWIKLFIKLLKHARFSHRRSCCFSHMQIHCASKLFTSFKLWYSSNESILVGQWSRVREKGCKAKSKNVVYIWEVLAFYTCLRTAFQPVWWSVVYMSVFFSKPHPYNAYKTESIEIDKSLRET